MNGSLICAGLWLVVANVLALIPSKDNHWFRAYVLMAIGVPLLIWLVLENGLAYGVIFLVAGGSILRWPVIYAWRYIKTKVISKGVEK